jgi:hypothetical protein
VSDLGALSIGFVLGLAIIGAVLLRNEDEVRRAWRRRRGIVEPEESVGAAVDGKPNPAPIGPGIVAGMGLLAVAYIGLAVASGGVFYIIFAAAYSLVFGAYLLRYRRSRSST